MIWTPASDGLSLVISPCIQEKFSRSPSRFPNEQCVEIFQAVVRWSLGRKFAVENLAIEPHTYLASALCEVIDQEPAEGLLMSSDRLQHMGDCRDGRRVGEDRIASQEGVLSLVAWLMLRPSQSGREVVGNEPAPLTTSRGAPHTQQTTEHHTGHDHGDVSNNPVHE